MIRALVLLMIVMGTAGASGPAPTDFKLNPSCPPGFEKTSTGVCELRTLYQFYDSLQDRGVGGTRTALPPHRDGFTPQQIDLGRYLFFDPLLSGDGTLSCASAIIPTVACPTGALDRTASKVSMRVARRRRFGTWHS